MDYHHGIDSAEPACLERATLRQSLHGFLVSDSDFHAFCLDYFPEIERRFGDGMDRVAKENLLLRLAPLHELHLHLQKLDRQGLLPPGAGDRMSTEPGVLTTPDPPLQPPRASFDAHWFINRPYEERRAEDELTFHKPVVLYGPELYGKTWLLQALLARARMQGEASGDQVASINLRMIDQTSRSSLETFLYKLAVRLCKELRLTLADIPQRFSDTRGGPIDALNDLLLYDVLPRRPGRLILALDNVDVIAGQPYQDEFFGLLRAWTDSIDDDFRRLHLLLGVSTAPALLVQQAHRSPFNISDAILVGDFDDGQLGKLSALYGINLQPDALRALRDLVGGHPYLNRLGLYEARRRNIAVADLMKDSGNDPRGGVFSSYLDHLRVGLNNQPRLTEAIAQLASAPSSPLPDDVAHRLERGALIKRGAPQPPGSPARYELRLPLYHHLVR